MDESEQCDRHGAAFPFPESGIGKRIDDACKAIGGREDAAKAAGVSAGMLRRYIRGESMPPFDVVVKLAQAAGKSLEWMAGIGTDAAAEPRTTRDSELSTPEAERDALLHQMEEMGRTTQLDDSELLEAILAGVESWIDKNGFRHDPEKKAALVTLLFSHFKRAGQVDPAKLEKLMKAVA